MPSVSHIPSYPQDDNFRVPARRACPRRERVAREADQVGFAFSSSTKSPDPPSLSPPLGHPPKVKPVRAVTFRTSDFDGLEEYVCLSRGISMSQHFTVFGGSFVDEARGGFSPPRRNSEPLAIWGFVLAILLAGVTTVATVTVTVAQAALH
jgi:hypothetical protein